ncbi:MAG: hypothetical protein ACPGPF_04860, partial [Pontibacterium sp.]
EQQYQHYDSEVAKLWTIAHQKNRPAIAEQKQLLKAQGETIAEMQKKVDGAASELGALEAKLSAQMQKANAASFSQLKKDVDAVNAEQKASLDSLVARIAASERSVRLAEEAVMEEMDALVSLQRTHGDRITALEAKGVDKSLEQRLSGVESSVKAFDAARLELSRTLLQVRQQINNLQLKIEKK